MPEVPLTFTDYREMKSKIHSQILQEIDLESLNKLQEKVARSRVGEAIRELLHRDRTPLALSERERMVNEIVDELFGLGPIEPLLADADSLRHPRKRTRPHLRGTRGRSRTDGALLQ